MEAGIRISESIARRFSSDDFGKQLRSAVRKGLQNAGNDLVFEVVRNMKTNKVWKTGFLASTIRSKVMDDTTLKIGSSYDAEMKTPVIYAAQVHFGGPLSPKKGKYLAWPVSREYGGIIPTESGVTGINAGDASNAPDYRVMGAIGSFVKPSRSGKTKILFYKFRGKGKESYKPAFILAESVKQDGEPFLIPVVEENSALVVTSIEQAFKDAGLI